MTTYQSAVELPGSRSMHVYAPYYGRSAKPQTAATEPNQIYSSRYSASLPQTRANPQPNFMPTRVSTRSNGLYDMNSRPTTPSSGISVPAREKPLMGTGKSSSDALIHHSLRIPKCISASGGSLDEFAAQMTCLFWFENLPDLKLAATNRAQSPGTVAPRLSSAVRPQEQFRRWVHSILSTTQVTQNVILLSLLFIYRLRLGSPAIKGRAGSEFRLLTVALMLGNKFLDDNTYTNKTWADVSAFSVQEIHVMEVEFLSNLRYNLLASEAEWADWLQKLACFHEYYQRGLAAADSPIYSLPSAGKLVSPPLSSPVNAHYVSSTTPNGSQEMASQLSATDGYFPPTLQSATWHPQNLSPLAPHPTLFSSNPRKRSVDDEIGEHPAKRSVATWSSQVPGLANPASHAASNDDRLHAHQLTLALNPVAGSMQGVPARVYPPSEQVALPPLQTGVRAMATVYSGLNNVAPPLAATIPTAPQGSQLTPTSTAQLVPNPGAATFGTTNRQSSPGGLRQLAAFNSSPLAEQFAMASSAQMPAIHTPLSGSPSFYLQQRPSPYRPIRHVNRLLYPPPSASLDQYHITAPVQPTQMHYQPLGRRNDVRTGIVPEFLVYNRTPY